MARKTSFYYAFHCFRRSNGVRLSPWDFWAVTMRWTEEPASLASGLPVGREASRSGAPSSRAAMTAAGGDCQGRRLQPFVHRSTCRDRRSRMSSTALRWTSTRSDTPRSRTCSMLPGGVGRRPRVHRIFGCRSAPHRCALNLACITVDQYLRDIRTASPGAACRSGPPVGCASPISGGVV